MHHPFKAVQRTIVKGRLYLLNAQGSVLSPEEGGSICVIAVSDDMTQETRQQALAAGYQVLITKPFEMADVDADRRCRL